MPSEVAPKAGTIPRATCQYTSRVRRSSHSLDIMLISSRAVPAAISGMQKDARQPLQARRLNPGIPCSSSFNVSERACLLLWMNESCTWLCLPPLQLWPCHPQHSSSVPSRCMLLLLLPAGREVPYNEAQL